MNSRASVVALFVLGLCCMNPLAFLSPRALLGMIALAGTLVAAIDCCWEKRVSLRALLACVMLLAIGTALLVG